MGILDKYSLSQLGKVFQLRFSYFAMKNTTVIQTMLEGGLAKKENKAIFR